MGIEDPIFSFAPVDIEWSEAAEDSSSHRVAITGTFESDGKKYQVTVSYDRDALAAKAGTAGLEGVNEQIQQAFDDMGVDTLASLSGHTLRTSYEDLRARNIHVLSGSDTEVSNWRDLPISGAIVRVQSVFSRIFGIEEMEEREETAEKRGDIVTHVEAVAPRNKLKDILPPNLRPKLEAARKLLLRHRTPEQANEILANLADKIIHDETAHEYRVVSPLGEQIGLEGFLDNVDIHLLAEGSFIVDTFVDGYLEKIVNSEENTDSAFVPSHKYQIANTGDGAENVVIGSEPLDLRTGSADPDAVQRVLIPVNINNGHWILYCFDGSDRDHPVLYKCDSAPSLTSNFEAPLQRLETQMIDDLHEAFDLPADQAIALQPASVTKQVNNNCGAHVCKNAEGFALTGDFPADPPAAFTPFRAQMLAAYLS